MPQDGQAGRKGKLSRIAVFGANGKIGRPLARWIRDRSPETALRLLVRSEAARADLMAEFPAAEILLADYYDLGSLERAFANADGAFVVTSDFIDEQRAMTNLVYAARTNPGLRHVVRLLADPPGMTLDRVPDSLKAFGGGTAVQHIRAKTLLEQSGLPMTFINIASYFMNNFRGSFSGPIRRERVLAIPRNRRMGFIDTEDIGACAASLLLSEDHRHIGQTYHLDNGNDVMRFDEVAALMSDVFGEEIRYDGSDETFLRLCGPGMIASVGRSDADTYFLNYFQFEQDNETVWRKTDIVPFLTGRPAKTLRTWLAENKQAILQ